MTLPYDHNSMRGRVAVVAGATRGAGRGIAAGLGEAGATVICTGRTSSVRSIPSTMIAVRQSRKPLSWSLLAWKADAAWAYDVAKHNLTPPYQGTWHVVKKWSDSVVVTFFAIGLITAFFLTLSLL